VRSLPPEPFPLWLALGWTAFITAALWLGLSTAFLLFGRSANDIVLLGLTQVAVYALVLGVFGLAWRAPLTELLALRRSTLALCLAAAVLGAALQIPATLLVNAVEHFFPLPEAVLRERIARITPRSTVHGIAIFAVVAGLGPLVEEFFFRGALFGALRRGHGALITIVLVSLCFALGHLDLRLLPALFLVALVIGQVREHSGSVWPGLALHAAFNSATLAVVFCGGAPGGKPPDMPVLFAISGCAVSALLWAVLRWLALSSPVAQNPRQSDVH